MARIVWTIAAVKDLDDIGAYIAKSSPQSAYHVSIELYEAPERLERFPQSGEQLVGYSQEVRQILKHGYRIVYQIRGDTCWIVALIHGSRDIDDAL